MVIHQWGWTVTLNPDGTTTARSPDGTKIFTTATARPPAPGNLGSAESAPGGVTMGKWGMRTV